MDDIVKRHRAGTPTPTSGDPLSVVGSRNKNGPYRLEKFYFSPVEQAKWP
jgi:hypothetical protein